MQGTSCNKFFVQMTVHVDRLAELQADIRYLQLGWSCFCICRTTCGHVGLAIREDQDRSVSAAVDV
jgi:hypothetical protein